jgi:hypothetical protein
MPVRGPWRTPVDVKRVLKSGVWFLVSALCGMLGAWAYLHWHGDEPISPVVPAKQEQGTKSLLALEPLPEIRLETPRSKKLEMSAPPDLASVPHLSQANEETPAEQRRPPQAEPPGPITVNAPNVRGAPLPYSAFAGPPPSPLLAPVGYRGVVFFENQGQLEGFSLVGNAATMQYHLPYCPYAAWLDPTIRVLFPDGDRAEAMGYHPCRYCFGGS